MYPRPGALFSVVTLKCQVTTVALMYNKSLNVASLRTKCLCHSPLLINPGHQMVRILFFNIECVILVCTNQPQIAPLLTWANPYLESQETLENMSMTQHHQHSPLENSHSQHPGENGSATFSSFMEQANASLPSMASVSVRISLETNWANLF